ncbi:MAG TPA: DUF2752 domain-containing protein [Pyrinomonadaceae bacterium]|nr:DUF2752 domain-containing protein [Chloracidobacterium sp.]MBP9936058.1 DUF2752 domain-containing protein [Pyrinomonadaceae bacterium]MBK7802167.1 DUF2752 domain-containing protein [Chloracidobacterium sp.]MBK9437686.1 DUF2752 domain-containing protein [Chloracidobacterium sp.]MBK9767863.1 DUF2752 domain-containing protein [Chloracidobacterium sp.]
MRTEINLPGFAISPLSERILAGAGASAIAVGSALVAYFDPTKISVLPICPLFSVTGIACPGCGLTRGFHALFHGDIISAIDFNLLVPVWAVIFAYVVLSLSLLSIRGRGLRMWVTDPKFLWGFLIVLVIFGILRNIPVYPLTFLFP